MKDKLPFGPPMTKEEQEYIEKLKHEIESLKIENYEMKQGMKNNLCGLQLIESLKIENYEIKQGMKNNLCGLQLIAFYEKYIAKPEIEQLEAEKLELQKKIEKLIGK